jgi:hypothetical protein
MVVEIIYFYIIRTIEYGALEDRYEFESKVYHIHHIMHKFGD